MKIDGELFRAILRETVEENLLACRGALSVGRVELTDRVETLSVSLGANSVLRANPAFMSTHCATEKHIKALLIHEFLHVLLGHTTKFDKMTRALNIALDAVINAIIHRRLGDGYSSMMARYYAGASGVLRLLRPMDEEERRAANIASLNRVAIDPLTAIHAALYNGTALADDILSIAAELGVDEKNGLGDERPVLLGDHERVGRDLTGEETARLRQSLVVLDAGGIFRDQGALRPQALRPTHPARGVTGEWKARTLSILRRVVTHDPQGVPQGEGVHRHFLPVLNAADRRGVLRSIWNPIISAIPWDCPKPGKRASVQVYLDVSASMNQVLPPLMSLLGWWGGYIKKPLWSFSTEVVASVVSNGQLRTRTTGGTRLGCVYEHLARTLPAKALVVTDGYVEDRSPRSRPPCLIEAIIPHDGHADILSGTHGIPVTKLPPL